MAALGSKLRTRDDGSVAFYCPGCGTAHGVHVNNAVPERNWTFNGDGNKPTFSPSVLVTRRTWTPPVTPENLEAWKREPWPQTKVDNICHSFVTDGRIQFLTDCTHALAGQTVDLPDFPHG